MAYPGSDPEQVPMMRADYTLLLLSRKAHFMERARAQQPSPPAVEGSEGSGRLETRITSMQQLYAMLSKPGGPRGV